MALANAMKPLAKSFPIPARWTALLAILAGLACVVLWTKQPPEPSYQGKRLSEWLAGYSRPSPETDEAVRRMGTNAIPTLLRMLRAKDSKATTWFMGLARKQHMIHFEYTYAIQRNAAAALAFDTLGAQASEAVPELIKIFEQNISPHSQRCTAWSLGGTRSAKAIPTLLQGTTNTDWATRCSAISALAQIHTEPEVVVPALTRFLKDPNREVQRITITSLELFGSDAKPAVSNLTQLLNDPALRTPAKYALKQIDPEAAAKLGLTTLVRTREGWELSK